MRWILGKALACALMLLAPAGTGAKEISEGDPVVAGRDWLGSKRIAWEVQSRALGTDALKAWVAANPNRFFSAAVENTTSNRPGDYATVRERHSYYDYIAFYLENGPHGLDKLRQTRFFAAATSVTIQAELGASESIAVSVVETLFPWLAHRWGVTRESVGTLVDINERLFAQNIGVIRRLLNEWKEPRDPSAAAPRDALDGLAFDVAMVDFEQGEVERYIREHSVSSARLVDINKMIRRGPVFPRLGTVAAVTPWVRKAGFTEPDFGNKGWRVAVGRALVFMFHRKAEAEYLAFMKSHPVRSVSRVALYDGLQAPAEVTRSTQGAFAVVGSWRTEAGALRHLAELKTERRDLHAAVFPPYGNSRYWMVATASFAPPDTAHELAARARRAGVASDAYVLTLRAIDQVGRPFSVAPRSVEAYSPVRLIQSPPFAYAEQSTRFLSVFRSADLSAAQEFMGEWKRRHDDLEVGLYRVGAGSPYDVVLAAFANDRQVEVARELARRIGMPSVALAVVQAARSDAVERIGEVADISEKVAACYKQGRVTAEALHACSGLWMTPRSLTRCFLANSCLGLGSDVLRTEEEVDAYLKANGITLGAKGAIKIDVTALPVPLEARSVFDGLQRCRNGAGGRAATFVECMATQLGQPASADALKCLRDKSGNAEAFKCLAASGAVPQIADKASCFQGDTQDERTVALCLARPDRAAQVAEAERCLAGVRGEGQTLTLCLNRFMPEDKRKLVTCLSERRTDPRLAALCPLGDGPEARRAVAAVECATDPSASAQQVGLCLAGVAGGDAAKVGKCVEDGGGNAAVAACILAGNKEVDAARRIYDCAMGGKSAAQLIAKCANGVVGGDAQKIAACVADSGASNEQLVACTASALLPKELAPVAACAAKSQSGVGLALCVAGPSMNAEWRIAAECASSTGGEPFSFAGCTAGRLTLKEFTQCLTGEIGKDCFGKENTIVQAFRTVGNDLKNCPNGGPCLGENNDIVIFTKRLEEGMHDLGKGLEQLGQALFGKDSDFCRGDLTSWAC